VLNLLLERLRHLEQLLRISLLQHPLQLRLKPPVLPGQLRSAM
tara:strand:- start:136 stop:264 length:129 start_codon:yes stop_codon:yes gene_type:complete